METGAVKDRVVRRLQLAEEYRHEVETVDRAVARLTPQEKVILRYLVVEPRYGNAKVVAQLLELEIGTVYKKKRKLLDKLRRLL